MASRIHCACQRSEREKFLIPRCHDIIRGIRGRMHRLPRRDFSSRSTRRFTIMRDHWIPPVPRGEQPVGWIGSNGENGGWGCIHPSVGQARIEIVHFKVAALWEHNSSSTRRFAGTYIIRWNFSPRTNLEWPQCLGVGMLGGIARELIGDEGETLIISATIGICSAVRTKWKTLCNLFVWRLFESSQLWRHLQRCDLDDHQGWIDYPSGCSKRFIRRLLKDRKGFRWYSESNYRNLTD